MPLGTCYKKSLTIYFEIKTPFMLIKEGQAWVARRPQTRIRVFKQSIGFCRGVNPREAYFSHSGFHIKKMFQEQLFS